MRSHDLDWLAPLGIVAAVALVIGQPTDLPLAYVTLAFTGAAAVAVIWLCAWIVRSAKAGEGRPIAALLSILKGNRDRIICSSVGILLAALLMSAFSDLKASIPRVAPFYLDRPLADFDRMIFGKDGWQWAADWFGFAFPAVSFIYSCWLPIQFATFSTLIFSRPSSLKSQALIAYALMWPLLGLLLAIALSSAGPIFYDRLYGGERFADLLALIGPTFSAPAADYLWLQYRTGSLELGAGISAMPSLHVAGSLWLALLVRRAFPRFQWLAWAYFGVIWLGSVMLGWHYATDGLVGAVGVLVLWRVSARLAQWRCAAIFAPWNATGPKAASRPS